MDCLGGIFDSYRIISDLLSSFIHNVERKSRAPVDDYFQVGSVVVQRSQIPSRSSFQRLNPQTQGGQFGQPNQGIVLWGYDTGADEFTVVDAGVACAGYPLLAGGFIREIASEADFKEVRVALAQSLTDALGPQGDPIVMQLEGCKSPEEARAFVERHRPMLEKLPGPRGRAFLEKARQLLG